MLANRFGPYTEKMRRSLLLLTLTAILCLIAARAVRAEVFILESGGHIEGLLLNPDQSPRTNYEIMSKQGGRIVVAAGRVVKVLEADPVADKGAEKKEEPAAKGAKGGSGKKSTQEEIMQQRGYRRYNGRWLSEQEIKSLEKKKEESKTVRGWYAKIKLWSGWLDGPRSEEAQKAFAEIDDPAAVAALADALAKDRRPPAQLLYIDALFRLNTPDANKALVFNALENDDVEIRLDCLDFLKKRKDPAVVGYFASHLRSKNNVMVNRAAVALRTLDNPAAVAALIDALVTVHEKKVVSGSGQTSAGFDNRSGGGLSMGSTTKIYKIPIKNRDVLDALISLTKGANFDYNVDAWKNWLDAQKPKRAVDARRD